MSQFHHPILIGLFFLMLGCSGNNSRPGGSGLIEATEVIVSAESSGPLQALYFDEGDAVRSGDTLALIDTTMVQLRIRETEALLAGAETREHTAALAYEQAGYNLDLAEKEFRRLASLLKSGSANQQSYDQAEHAHNLAALARRQAAAASDGAKTDIDRIAAARNILRKQLADCFPRIPLTGTIVNKYVEVGELVAPGRQLVKVARLDTVRVKIYLSPSDLGRIKIGGAATVDPEDDGSPLAGRVTWISDAAEFTPKNVQTKEARADLVYAVKVTIPNPAGRLKIGMPVAVVIE